VDSGLAAFILIEDPTDHSVPKHIQDVSCPSNCKHDIQLVFQSTLSYSRDLGFSDGQRLVQDNLFMFELHSHFFLSVSFGFAFRPSIRPRLVLFQTMTESLLSPE